MAVPIRGVQGKRRTHDEITRSCSRRKVQAPELLLHRIQVAQLGQRFCSNETALHTQSSFLKAKRDTWLNALISC